MIWQKSVTKVFTAVESKHPLIWLYVCVLHFMSILHTKIEFSQFCFTISSNASWIFLQSQVYKQQDFPTTWSAWKGSCWCYWNYPKQWLQKAKINFCSDLRGCESFYKGSSAVTDSIHGSLSPVLLWRHQMKWWSVALVFQSQTSFCALILLIFMLGFCPHTSFNTVMTWKLLLMKLCSPTCYWILDVLLVTGENRGIVPPTWSERWSPIHLQTALSSKW